MDSKKITTITNLHCVVFKLLQTHMLLRILSEDKIEATLLQK